MSTIRQPAVRGWVAWPASLALAVAALGASGCGVLTVDVDVYKGPLANHEQVQAEQFRVMLVGAKSLLITLRDQLEWGHPPSLQDGQRCKYKPDYMPVPHDYWQQGAGGPKWLEDEQAIRVNAILGLYHDAVDPELETFVARGDRALERFAAARKQLDPAPEQDKRFWSEIARGFLKCPNEHLLWRDPNNRGGFADAFAKLKEGYRAFHVPAPAPNGRTRREVEGIIEAHNALFGMVALGTSVLQVDPNSPGSAKFEALTQPKNVGAHAGILFADNAHQEAFVERTIRIAQSFGAADAAVGDMVTVASEFLAFIRSSDAPSNLPVAMLTELVGELLAEIADPDAFPTPLTQNTVFDALRSAPDGTRSPGVSKKDILRNAIVRNPEQAAQTLLDIHRGLQSGRAGQPLPKGGPSPSRRGVGLDPLELVNKFQQLMATWRELVRSMTGAGLERGRLAVGLERLLDSYLEKQHALPPDAGESQQAELINARERLLEALVRFAQKVLYIANHTQLLCLGQSHGKADKEDVRRSVMVLQAIGNSILGQADELRQQALHKTRLADGTDREVNAVRRARKAGPAETFDSLSAIVTQRRDEGQTKVRELTEAATRLAGEQKTANKHVQDANDSLIRAESAAGAAEPAAGHDDLKQRYADARDVLGSLGRDKLLDGVKDDPNSKTVYDRIREAVSRACDKEVIDAKGDARQADRLRNAVIVLEDQTVKNEAAAGTPTKADVLTRLLVAVEARLATQVVRVREIERPYKEALAKGNAAKKALAYARARADVVKAAVEKNQKDKQAADVDAERYEDAVDEIGSRRRAVLDAADSLAAKPVGVAVIAALLGRLEADRDAKPGDTAVGKKLDHAIAVVKAHRAPLDPQSDLELTGKDAKGVLDDLIAVLRHEHLEAIRQDGPDSQRAQRAAAAIEAAYNQRSGMVYLRPAMAYLRNSFPASALQPTASLGWKNNLFRHATRSLPFAELGHPANKDLATQREIDKQFWQNVNRVRVAGAGNTNYVVAKDDIGNWYVKNYSADPNDIIKSAKNLAMFSAGMAIFPGGGVGELAKTGAAPEGSPKSAPSVLARQYVTATSDYRQRAKEMLADAKDVAGHLADQLAAAWSGEKINRDAAKDLPDINDDKEVKDKLLALDLEKLPPEDAPHALTEALWAVKRFHVRLDRQLRQRELAAADPNAHLSAQVADNVRGILLTDFLKPHLARAQRNVQDYSIALRIVGDTGKPSAAP